MIEKSSEIVFVKDSMLCLKNRDVYSLANILSIEDNLKYETYNLFKSILNLSEKKNFLNSIDLKLIPEFSSWMPGNFKGLDVFKLLSSSGSVLDIPDCSDLELTVLKDFSLKPETILCLSCDSIYFKYFFDDVFKSFEANRLNDDCLVVHVANPSPEVINLVQSINVPWFSFTYEIRENAHIAYHACSRYLVAYNFIKKYKCPIIISDFDVEFISSPSIVKSLKNPKYDPSIIDLCFDDPPRLPWQIYLAGFLYLRYNDKVLNFLKKFSNAVEFIFDKNLKEYWYIDQNILFFLFNSGDFCYAKSWSARDKILVAQKKYEKEKKLIKNN